MAATSIRQLATADLTDDEIRAVRRLLWAAFEGEEGGEFTEDDWQHGLGGIHVIGSVDGRIVAHGSVVGREIHVGGRPLATGYVEAVAVDPAEQRRGHGTAVMRDVGAIITSTFELGVLGTGEHGFYERLGWRTWQGPSYVRLPSGDEPTPDEDGYIMVLPTPITPSIDIHAPISCDWRPGDVW
ncbi:MAG TPA: GNAT family N-acetyltransferase [Candidatus Limnocylindrales bacterium]|nr:GNAT family N-acetyltransferase [Candidatus Limnocylindrales bacterium]